MKIHLDILTKRQRDIFRIISIYFSKDFYLAEGIALALQIGHRESEDFDLFREKPVSFNVKQRLVRAFGRDILTLVDTSDELTVIIENNVKITFLYFYWSPLYLY